MPNLGELRDKLHQSLFCSAKYNLPYALATFSSLCELTIMRLSFLLEQLVSLPDMGL